MIFLRIGGACIINVGASLFIKFYDSLLFAQQKRLGRQSDYSYVTYCSVIVLEEARTYVFRLAAVVRSFTLDATARRVHGSDKCQALWCGVRVRAPRSVKMIFFAYSRREARVRDHGNAALFIKFYD